ncbi:MAG TPA: hypothetical protein GXZ63_04225 [Mollicutes bacterium]|nr:hypothetical protein [Mollicutes bacterium]
MKGEENKVSFDLSKLDLGELIKLYEKITGFLEFLSSSEIIQKEKKEEKNE